MSALLAAANDKPQTIDLEPAFRGFIDGVIHTVSALWPLFLIVGLIALGKVALQLYRLHRISTSGIRDIDAMDGGTFEVFLTTLFRRLGYRVEHTGRRGDFGADLIVAKNGSRIAVQAKCWSKNVGVKAVQEAVAAKGYYDCDAAMVVTNRRYSEQARALAKKNRVELWGRDELIERLLAANRQAKEVDRAAPAPAELPPAAEVSASTLPPLQPPLVKASSAAEAPVLNGPAHCVTCGDAVSEKVREYCLARPARFSGQVYCFTHQRRARPTLAPSE